MNRSLRRMQLKEPKAKTPRASAGRALPRTGPARPAPRRESRGGILSYRPQFLVDIINELKKVVWPTRDDVVHLTIVVVLVTILLGAALGGIDMGFGWIIDHTLLRR